ncbi:MAG TPA: FtsX-like permease family protein [Streptosporangiaceae bacterium]|nr:FtsX-like permease family protein [Streptosporangiaceae bacterium]
MGKIRLIGRLVGRDLRYRPGPAVLLVLAITAATATLALGLVLHGVTDQPYLQTRTATRGPDVVAQLGGFGRGAGGPSARGQARTEAQVRALTRASGVTAYSGPYPVASAFVRFRGLAAPVELEGRAQAPALVEQPAVTAGTWVRPGGVVLERTFAEALGAGVGDRVTLDGRAFRVAGIAVSAADLPYPNLCYSPGGGCVFDAPYRGPAPLPAAVGLAWVTEPDARRFASARAPLYYFLNLKLTDPAAAPAFASRYGTAQGSPYLIPWQAIQSGDGLLVQDEQQVLSPGALLVALLAIAGVAVLAGGRMAERTRRVGLLKAVGGTPETVAITLLAENLVLALAAAAAGLVIGRLGAPLIASPGAALVGSPGAPSLTLHICGLVVGVAFFVALAATLPPAIRGARTSTVGALADAARPPRRHGGVIALSARLPVPLLFGLRLVARRPRRALLSAASVAVTATGLVATLAFRTTVRLTTSGLAGQLTNPVAGREEQMLAVLTVALVALTILNAVCTAWATVLDARQVSALARALGASPRQVTAGIVTAQVLPALPGSLLGIPLGIELFAAAAQGAGVVVPPASWLAVAVLATLAAVAVLAGIPAWIGARHPVTPVLQAETA